MRSMKLAITAIALMLLAGCDQAGRYQFATTGERDEIWRFDTKTGQIEKCLFGIEKTICSSHSQ